MKASGEQNSYARPGAMVAQSEEKRNNFPAQFPDEERVPNAKSLARMDWAPFRKKEKPAAGKTDCWH